LHEDPHFTRQLEEEEEALPSRVLETWAHPDRLSADLLPEVSKRTVAQERRTAEN
jgi:hypothetical protein